MRLLIFGPQGAGKGTQSARLAEKFDIAVISTGDMFRWAVNDEGELGEKVRHYLDDGQLVPNDLTVEVVRDRLAEEDARAGFVLDGFPRNLAQADALDEILAEQEASLDAALVLEVSEEVSLRRLAGRRVCRRCGRNYHVDTPPKEDWTCERCGGQVVQRSDDQEATIARRLATYHEQTAPLKEHYRKRGLLREVDGTGTLNEVFDRILSVL
ncbi:adenylate kinase [soil metagenome]